MRIAAFYCLLLISPDVFPQYGSSVIRGRVTDSSGVALPYANVYLSGTSTGTTTNESGEYLLSLPSGRHEIVFRYVGYVPFSGIVESGEKEHRLDAVLARRIVTLPGMTVSADAEDPACAIIRRVIINRKHYLEQVREYTCNVYIKGVQRIRKAPERVLGIPVAPYLNLGEIDTVKGSIIYLSESVSRFGRRYPGQVREEMLSSRVSGDNRAFSWNRASEMMFDFYENLIRVDILNPRGFVSPVSDQAFLYYDYRLEDSYPEGNVSVHRIRVMAKRDHDPVFNGYLFITDSTYRIHGLDLFLTRSNQVEYVDTLYIRQSFAPVNDTAWMCLSQRFDFSFSVLGFEGNGTFVGVYSDYNLAPGLPEKYFKSELLNVTEGSNEKDSLYWSATRPVPLTGDEKKDYSMKDSLQGIMQSRQCQDSLDALTNQPVLSRLFLLGYSYRCRYRGLRVGLSPLVNSFQFNTVEGFNAGFRAEIEKEMNSGRNIQAAVALRYGFQSYTWYGHAEMRVDFRRKLFEQFMLDAGRNAVQFDGNDPISPLANTLYALFDERNFMKLYERSYLLAGYRLEPVNGLRFWWTAEYAQRSPLRNHSYYRFFDYEGRLMEPNDPLYSHDTIAVFIRHRALITEWKARIRFGQKYITYPDKRYVSPSAYPEITLAWRQGWGEVHFAELTASVSGSFRSGLWGRSDWELSGGHFPSAGNAGLMDYHHFSGNRTIFASGYLYPFQLLDYYVHSTAGTYAELHAEHHFNGFIINKLPVLRHSRWREVVALNAFVSRDSRPYLEVSAGLEHILKVLRIDWVVTVTGPFRQGLCLGVVFY